MKTVRHEICGPANGKPCPAHRAASHTQVLDVDGALVPQARVVHLDVPRVGNWRPIATLCDPQAMSRKLGCFCNFLENLCGRGVGADGNGLGKVLDRAA